MLKVEVLMGEGFDIWLHSYFLVGLIQLAQRNEVKLSFVRNPDWTCCKVLLHDGYPLFTIKCTDNACNYSRIISFDPKDQSDAWQIRALDECDVYFKRSTYAPDTGCLTKSQQLKVLPINPMFATWSSDAPVWTLRTCVDFVRTSLGQLSSRRSLRTTINALIKSSYGLATLSSLNHYEDAPTSFKRKQILFQTRLWDPEQEDGSRVEACNNERVEMVRILRNKLGRRLVGGLIRTPFSEKHYPDLLSDLTPTSRVKRPEFIRLCRQFLVRVNIKALFDATPYSLGESLAANNCLVSQTIRNNFASPLVEGKHYLGFTTPDECVDVCLELLNSDEKANILRKEAHEYYRTAVRPVEAMKTFLTLAMSR